MFGLFVQLPSDTCCRKRFSLFTYAITKLFDMLFTRSLDCHFFIDASENRASFENYVGQKTISCIAALEVMVFPIR